MVVNVPRAKRTERPIYLNHDIMGSTFRRNWEGDYHCSASEVKAMLRDQPDYSTDMEIIESLTIDQLNYTSLEQYRTRHKTYREAHPWGGLDNASYLEKIGGAAYGKDGYLHPTCAGLLMFGDEYRIVREYPDFFLDYREMLDPSIRWTDRLYSSTGDWSGNLYDFYFKVYNKLIQDIKVPFKTIGGNRIDDTPVHRAIREVLANCLVNYDVLVPRGVVILKERNKIVLENPGYIRVGKDQMRKGGESDPRNRTIMKMFNMIGIGERAGSGVPELFSVWEEQGWEEPLIEERFGDASRTILTLSFEKKPAIKTGDKGNSSIKPSDIEHNKGKKGQKPAIKTGDKKPAIKSTNTEHNKRNKSAKTLLYNERILDFMQPKHEYQLSDFCELLGLKRSRTKEILQNLINSNDIKPIGSNRNRRYILIPTN